ncbi:conserved Plasmodium protein, unknown function [Plasmodium malariae]|uniref:Uncharacterized protein n=1 Tax=Plasmodium malariae TaxID=5858 RepID=A0A1C3KFA7_PLAMA|nr:conserved Plasmodium protein, unknown function [Plasmodium malariae]
MDLEIVEDKLKKLEEELEQYRKNQFHKVEKIINEVKLLETNIKELNKRKITKCLVNANKSFEKKIIEKTRKCSKKKKYIKDIKKDIVHELMLLKEKKKKNNNNFLNTKFNFQYIHAIENEINKTFLVLNIQRQYILKFIFEKLNKFKNKSLAYYDKYLNIQKEIDTLFHSINKSALTDIFVLTKNSLFFQKELATMFQQFHYQIENSLTHT